MKIFNVYFIVFICKINLIYLVSGFSYYNWIENLIISIFIRNNNINNPHVPTTYLSQIDSGIPCGIKNNDTISNRIVGGKEGIENEYPWLVSLQTKYYGRFMHNCGGSVISSKYILTAAHCIHSATASDLKVVAGKFDLKKKEDCEQSRNVLKIITNQFKFLTLRNDIALLLLDEPLILNQDCVAPICLPKGDEQFQVTAKVAGWGTLTKNGKIPTKMNTVSLSIIDFPKCLKMYDKSFNKLLMHDCQICTYTTGKDACQGDSGGPLMCTDSITNKIFICGIISWGDGCADFEKPGVYTKVDCYTEWILKYINNST